MNDHKNPTSINTELPNDLRPIADSLDRLGRAERAGAPDDLASRIAAETGPTLKSRHAKQARRFRFAAPLAVAAAVVLAATVVFLAPPQSVQLSNNEDEALMEDIDKMLVATSSEIDIALFVTEDESAAYGISLADLEAELIQIELSLAATATDPLLLLEEETLSF